MKAAGIARNYFQAEERKNSNPKQLIKERYQLDIADGALIA